MIQVRDPQTTATGDLSSPPLARRERAITWRSVLVGSTAVCIVAGLAPYNDFLVGNAFITQGFLPPAIVLAFFLLVVVFNALLHRFLPRRALTSGELAVIMGMALVGCSIPGPGLMRTFLPLPVAPFHLVQTNPQLLAPLQAMSLPSWLFPVSTNDVYEASRDPIVTWFYSRVPPGESPPYAAWIVPLMGWGIFLAGLYTALIGLAAIVRHQWMHNERLLFPLVQLELAMLQAPSPGRSLNAIFRSRSFWISCVAVLLIHGLAGLHAYFPKNVPEIPLSYDLTTVLSEEPWSYLHRTVRANRVYFTFLGLAYFMPARVAFSIWSMFLIIQLVIVQQMMVFRVDIQDNAWFDQNLSAAVVWCGAMAWVGRHHWGKVLRHLLRGPDQPGETSYRGPALAVVAGTVVMAGWLLAVGVTWWAVAMLLSLVFLAHLTVSRIVAETGLPVIRSVFMTSQPYSAVSPTALSRADIFFAGALYNSSIVTTQGSPLTFSLHAGSLLEGSGANPRAWHWGGLIAWSLLLSFVVACASGIHVEYQNATGYSLDSGTVNGYGTSALPEKQIAEPLVFHAQGRFPPKRYDSTPHFIIGFVVMAVLQFATWRWASWPFAPVGYLVATSNFVVWLWFSVLLGWLAKVLIVRFGGAKLLRDSRPFFIGLVFGEALAVGLWLAVSLVLASLDLPYKVIRLLPG